MSVEIERKFLVKGDFKTHSHQNTRIVQGYLSTVPERTVRVRIRGEKGYLTIKGLGSTSGMSRYEWEKEIPVHEAEELIKLCEPGVIEKQRYLVTVGQHTYEVDVFGGENADLIMAEIELNSEDEEFLRPDWLGEEVTHDARYYNAYLAKHPYSKWK